MAEQTEKDQQIQTQDPEYKLPSRIAAYPAVSAALETAKEYYNWGKEASPVVAYAESKLEGGIQWLTPIVEPYLETAKPYLLKADDLGNQALDKVEANAQYIKSNVDAQITTASDAYKDVAEKASYFSKRIGDEAYARLKLENLKIKEGEELLNHYTADLVHYAAKALDSASKGLETGTALIKESPKEVKEKIQTATQDALAAVYTAVEHIQKQIPPEVTKKFEHVKEVAIKGEEARVELFASVAQSSSQLLHEVKDSLKVYLAKGEAVPQQLLSSTYERLHSVLGALLTFVDNKPAIEAKQETQEEVKQ